MRSATLRKVGGSVVMAIPKDMLEMLGLAADSKVAVGVEDGRLVVSPERKRPKYTLQELLDQCDFDAPMSEEDLAWVRDGARGREVI